MKSTKRNLRSITLTLRALTLLCLTLASVGTWATDYVFVYSNGYLAAGNNNTTTYVTTFDPATCIWRCYNGNTEASLATNASYQLRLASNTNIYLTSSNTNGTTISTTTTAPTARWRTDANGHLIYRQNKVEYYTYYRGNNWRTSSATSTDGNDNDSYALLSTNGNIRTDYRATAYAVETTDHPATGGITITANPATINDVNGTSNLQTNFTQYTQHYVTYRFNNANHNWYGNSDHGNTTPTPLYSLDGTTYNWTMTNAGTNATLNPYGAYSAGLTYSAASATDRVVTVKLTASNAAYDFNQEATANVTLKAVNAPQFVGLYNIVSNRNTAYYVTVSPDNFYNGNAATPNLVDIQQPDIWALYSYNGGYYLQHASDGKWAVSNRNGNGDYAVHIQEFANPVNSATLWNISDLNATTQTIQPSTKGALYWNAYAGVGQSVGYYSNDDGSKWRFLPVNSISAPTIAIANGGQVTLSHEMRSATIYYTTDGTTPTTASTRYTGQFDVANGTTVKAIAVFGTLTSATNERLYRVYATPVAITSLSQITDPYGAYILTADVNASGSTTIANFYGSFDGDYHVITGLTHPIFGTITNAEVKNVIVDNSTITRNGDVGAIACQAAGASRIYNCGILAKAGTSSVTSTLNDKSAGGIVGYLNDYSRVINCYSYADVSAVTNAGGIVGFVQNQANQENVATAGMVMNCMFYGNITGGTAKAPIFGGWAAFSNAGDKALNGYNYYRYESPYSLNGEITQNKYNCALAAEERYLTRFEFYRNLLNSNRELAAWYATGSVDDAYNKMAKWVLDKSIAPYPILKPQGIYPSIINFDAANAPTTTERNKGGKLDTLNVSISQGTGAPEGANITTSSLTLNITDKDEDNFNYNYYKVQLPYYNEVGTGNYTNNKVVTGWKVSISGGTNSFTTNSYDAPDYNFADRKSTEKDNYNTSGRVFAQGGYYNVPEGVTSISIEPYWGNAVYLSDPYYDVVYSTSYTATDVTTMGARYTNGNSYSNQNVYTTITNAINALQTGTTVYDNAIVLVGNYHLYCGNNATLSSPKPFTVMSADLNNDNEPDYSFIYQHTDRQPIAPIRFDFLNWPGIGMAQKVEGTTRMPNQGIFCPRGWFEITNTCIVRFTEFEYDDSDRGSNKALSPLILLGGIYEQITSTQHGTVEKTTYIHLGDNAWFKEFQNGVHSDDTKQTPHRPISVTGGEYEKFYLSGTFKPDANVVADNAECYINGGKFGELAGAGQEQIKGNVTWLIDHADIREFYGGGINAAKPITGNITVTIDNSYVDQYCGGPKFGNMSVNKTVATTATGSTFGKYFGAGYGGTSYNRVITQGNYQQQDYDWNRWANDYGKEYSATNGGISTNYEYEFFAWAGGGSDQNVGRFYVNYASFSLAQTNDVSSTLNNCTVLQDYYGGGSLGKVAGNATSVLNGCTIYGNAFGGGFSATIPSLEVMDKAGFNPLPSYNGNVGVYNQGGYPATVTYTWSSKGSTTNPFTSDNEGAWIYTGVDLTSLGEVTGKTTITVTGNTFIQGLIDGETKGGVFGGGNESAVKGGTEVNINAYGAANKAHKINNVYGGANKADVKEATTVNVMAGFVGNVFGGNNESGTKSGTIVVNVAEAEDSTIRIDNIYGGGNLAPYTAPGDDSKNWPKVNVGIATIEHDIFGGGLGSSATVTGNPQVTVSSSCGDCNNRSILVKGSVYGGGSAAPIKGNTNVLIDGSGMNNIININEYVFGGGWGETAIIKKVDSSNGGDTHVKLKDKVNVSLNVYGGGNGGAVEGDTEVIIGE